MVRGWLLCNLVGSPKVVAITGNEVVEIKGGMGVKHSRLKGRKSGGWEVEGKKRQVCSMAAQVQRQSCTQNTGAALPTSDTGPSISRFKD